EARTKNRAATVRERTEGDLMKHRGIPLVICVSAFVLALAPLQNHAQSTQQPAQPPAPGRGQPTPHHLTIQQESQEDQQRVMAQLHIGSLRPGVNARVLGATNYDETKANPYPDLPDALTLKNGKKATSAKTWWNQRRPEIVEDFDREVYGRLPKTLPKVKWE